MDISRFRKNLRYTIRRATKVNAQSPLTTSRQKSVMYMMGDIMQLPHLHITTEYQTLNTSSTAFGSIAWLLDFDPIG